MAAGKPGHGDETGAQRLVFHNHLAQVDRDPQTLAQRLAQHYTLLDFGPRQGHENEFLHRSSTCGVGSLLLSGGFTTPVVGSIGEREGIGSVNFILDGSISYESNGKDYAIDPNRPVFFSPDQAYNYSINTHFNGVVFDVDLQRLRRTAAAIAGLGVSERRFAADLDFPRAIQPTDRRTQQLLSVFTKIFSMLDHPELESSGDFDHLGVDELIYRTLALLLCPRLQTLLQNSTEPRSPREQIFEEVVEWGRANLHQPINLSDLEKRSGYSRRNLQLAFQQRFGCGPIQWIRQQRLEQARQDLLRPEPNDTVAAVANRYGFSSLSAFSRDFRNHFGLRPSQVLREGKRHGEPA
jgi:AraC-like DNA-binding protein